MPRPERPLELPGDVLADFAAGLRALRDQAGRPGYRMLATKAHYSATTLSDAAGGRALPSLAVTLAYVRACGGNTAEWEQRWHAVAAHRAAEGPSSDIRAPYVGLGAFEPADADLFFGREALTEDLVRRVRANRFVGVFGASGAGKSSVLRAGLVPRMRATDGPVIVLTPGPQPVEECAVGLSLLTGDSAPELAEDLRADPESLHRRVCRAMAGRPADTDLVLVVDQFEEVFTLCRDERERRAFITMLVRGTRPGTSRLRVVLGVRTDFYTHCARIPDLVDALRDAQLLVGPMTQDELRRAITQPAVRAGCTVEGALLAAVMADCGGEPAVLPLLSHALLETWRRRRGTTLALTGYQAAGGIAHAIAHTAEHTYGEFDQAQQRLSRSLFQRLTALGDGTEDTKRRIRRDELDPDTTVIVDRLTEARLLTVDHDRIEITHEALIRNWPRLRDWLATDRDGLRVHRQLTEATGTWLTLDRDPDALYRGSRLAIAQEWHASADAVLTRNEQDFLATSLAAQSHERATARRRTRRLRQLVALLSVLVVVAGIAIVVAVRTQETVTSQRDLAQIQNALNAAATVSTTDPDLAVQLTMAAYRMAGTEQTSSGVLNAVAAPHARRLTRLPNTSNVAFSQDGRLAAAVYEDGTIRIWDLTDPRHIVNVATHRGSGDPAQTAEFSPDGRTLTVAGGGSVQLWDISTPRQPRLRTTFDHTATAALDTDRQLIATAGSNGVELRNSTDLAPEATLPTGSQASFVAFGANAHLMAVQTTGGRPDEIQLWDITDPHRPIRAGDVVEPAGSIHAVAVSPTAPVLAVATGVGATVLWDLSDPHQPRAAGRFEQSGLVMATAFSADGRTLATASMDGSVSVWNVVSPSQPRQVVAPIAVPAPAITIGFGPGGHSLLAAAVDDSIQLIDLRQLELTDTADLTSATVSSDGRTFATADVPVGASAGRTQLWNVSDPNQPAPTATLPIDPTTNPLGATGLALSPQGTVLAAGDNTGISVWNTGDGHHPTELTTVPGPGTPVALSQDGQVLATDQGTFLDVSRPGVAQPLFTLAKFPMTAAFGPRGHLLATASNDNQLKLWDATNMRKPSMTASLPTDSETATLTFDRTGRLLVASGSDGSVQMWNVGDPGRPVPLMTLRGSLNTPNPVAFSPDSRTLAMPGVNQTVELWDITDPARPTLRAVLTNALRPVAFYADGHTLAVVGANGSLQLRETDLAHATAQLCGLGTTAMTSAAWDLYFPGRPYAPPCR